MMVEEIHEGKGKTFSRDWGIKERSTILSTTQNPKYRPMITQVIEGLVTSVNKIMIFMIHVEGDMMSYLTRITTSNNKYMWENKYIYLYERCFI